MKIGAEDLLTYSFLKLLYIFLELLLQVTVFVVRNLQLLVFDGHLLLVLCHGDIGVFLYLVVHDLVVIELVFHEAALMGERFLVECELLLFLLQIESQVFDLVLQFLDVAILFVHLLLKRGNELGLTLVFLRKGVHGFGLIFTKFLELLVVFRTFLFLNSYDLLVILQLLLKMHLLLLVLFL